MSRLRHGLVRTLPAVLLVTGLLLLADVGITLVWQEPLTAAIGLVKRADTDKRYLTLAGLQLSVWQRRSLAQLTATTAQIAFLAHREAREVPDGAALGELVIPAIGASYDFVQGTDTGDLERGPGHYPGTALPGLGQTVAIAGHRTTYLAPFRKLNELEPGDRILLKMPYGTFTYSVQRQLVVNPNELWITRSVGYERLVLSACTPLFSAAQRIVVFARLVQTRPLVQSA